MSWYLEAGNDSDIVLSSRIRLARNLKGIPFPNRMNDENRKKVLEQISDVMLKRPGNDLMRMDIASLPETDRRALIEKHLISEELAKGQEGQSVFISKDENIHKSFICKNTEAGRRTGDLSGKSTADRIFGKVRLPDGISE